MDIVHQVEISMLVAGSAGLLALLGSWIARTTRIPAPATFLAAGVAAAALLPSAADAATFERVATLGSYALVLILFEGGFSNGGWLRVGPCVRPIFVLGIVGTLVTAAVLAFACHVVIGLPVELSVLVAVALAPTDPAAVFSVLGEHDLDGSTDIVLEGEAGANDPVGISLMLGAIGYYELGDSMGGVAASFALQLVVGVVVGVAAGVVLATALRQRRFVSEDLHVVVALGGAFITFSLASALHGSGFLAVFVAGLVAGRQPRAVQERTEGFLATTAALAELSMFTALGLTIAFADLGAALVEGLVAFGLLTLIIRPLVVLLALAPERLTRSERLFVAWGGLKGAVPILLAAFAVLEHVPQADRVYAIVFVAVAASVLVQGTSVPYLARRMGLLRP